MKNRYDRVEFKETLLMLLAIPAVLFFLAIILGTISLVFYTILIAPFHGYYDEILPNEESQQVIFRIIAIPPAVVLLGAYFLRKHYLEKIERIDRDHQQKVDSLKYNHDKAIKSERAVSNMYKNKNESLIECIMQKDNLYRDLSSNGEKGVENIISLYNDFIFLQDELSARYLEEKKRPALIEAKRIREVLSEKRQLLSDIKRLDYRLSYLLALFPDLDMYIQDLNFSSVGDLQYDKSKEELEPDDVRKYLSKQEYLNLSSAQRNQLALDRYIQGRSQSSWEIGRDYEMYIAFKYRSDGWDVEDYGIKRRLEDLGRDIIAKKGMEVQVIQCKRWSKDRLIHEKHIGQLFATTKMFEMEINNTKESLFNHKIRPVFITTARLSDEASRFAKYLNVDVYIIPHEEHFPRIKCNINGGDKIYHLPFDQQYDNARIDKNGEFYAYTVEEAERAGFRRARRHFVNRTT